VQGNAGLVAEVPAVVGEMVGEQRECHRVELDGIDVVRAEVAGGQDLVAGRRPDDQHAVRGQTEGAEGNGARI
jgi:hypothetical protein